MIGYFTIKVAVETPDGDLRVFTAPLDWAPGTLYVSINDIVQTFGFTYVGGLQIAFDTAPAAGDIIGFLYPTA